MTLVSSANKIGSNTEFILRGRLFIYIYIYYEQQALELILVEIRCFNVPQSEKKF
jgi:hypothetical protein